MAIRELDNKAAIMIVIEHLGDVQHGQKCSAVFFDGQRIRAEKEFHAKLYSQNGVHDPEILHFMRRSRPMCLPPLIDWSPSNQHKEPTDKLVSEKLIKEQGKCYRWNLDCISE